MNDLPGPLEVLREIARSDCLFVATDYMVADCGHCRATDYLIKVDKWKDYKVRVLTEDTYLVSAPDAELAKARVFLGKHKGETRWPTEIEAQEVNVMTVVEK